MNNDNNDFSAYDYDSLSPGYKLKIEHTVYSHDNLDLSDLISKPIEEVRSILENNITIEKAAYDKAQEDVKAWEKIAAVTNKLNRAVSYLELPQVKHTSNRWNQNGYGRKYRSNMVYIMEYFIYERSSWRTDEKKHDVTWSIFTNSPNREYNKRVAGQERTFNTNAEAEKYMQGRIKAYEHLFTQISPPIPNEYEEPFKVYGHLLPGYTTDEMQRETKCEKPSVRKTLNALKTQTKSTSRPAKLKNEPER